MTYRYTCEENPHIGDKSSELELLDSWVLHGAWQPRIDVRLCIYQTVTNTIYSGLFVELWLGPWPIDSISRIRNAVIMCRPYVTLRLQKMFPRGRSWLCSVVVLVTATLGHCDNLMTWWLCLPPCTQHLPCAISSCLLASPRAEKRSSLILVSALRLFSRCWVFSCMADSADINTSVSFSFSLYFRSSYLQQGGKQGVCGISQRKLCLLQTTKQSLSF